jgi:hypothetical protein
MSLLILYVTDWLRRHMPMSCSVHLRMGRTALSLEVRAERYRGSARARPKIAPQMT